MGRLLEWLDCIPEYFMSMMASMFDFAFVVDSAYRGKGVGRKLLQEAESWAVEQGAIEIGLNSGNREERKIAHQFYFNMGYEGKSTGFSKKFA
ncbi:GNAT family N-acetyltransferase [Bacillus sp. CGMCC 1.16607]|uniref:GNAT family N-acetyltransferase n=1 Tax=Bacillus sp. CGMCC 1.16607 TaxID=3351842 RepID=UPI0036420922